MHETSPRFNAARLAGAAAALAMLGVTTSAYAQAAVHSVTSGGKDPASLIANGVTSLAPEARGMFDLGAEFAAKLKRLDHKELLPVNITPANFLEEMQRVVKTSSARDLASMSLQAGRLALQIEEIKLDYLRNKLCTGGGVAPLADYATEVDMGCKLLGAQQTLNRLKFKALAMVEEK